MPEDIEINRVSSRGDHELTIRIDGEEVKKWKAAASRHGLGLAEWIMLSLTLADKLSLVDGYEKTPSVGRRLDPILARAILEAAQGQPWEHRALLLLGMANPVETVKKPKTRGRIPAELIDVFAEFGIPYRDVAPNYYAVLGPWVLSWQELAFILIIWKDSLFDWCYLSRRGLQERAGMTQRDAMKAVERTVAQGLVEREPISSGRVTGAKTRTRLTREVGEALLRGEIRPATVDDSYSESYLTAQSLVSNNHGSGSEVDPLLLASAREAAMRGQTSASDVIRGYLDTLGQSTT